MPQAQQAHDQHDANANADPAHEHKREPAEQHQQDEQRAADAKKQGLDKHPGGNDALGKKENLLAPFFADMQAVASELVGEFTPLGLHFRPEILLATAMQEAASHDPANARSFDNGLGIMQITPYKGQLSAPVAKAIGWDNAQGVEWNIQHSRWRDARANLLAGGYTMLGKAHSIKGGVAKIWGEMDEGHRWRAVLYAYNAGEGSAIRALKQGGPNAPMISTFTHQGKQVSHDYTAEIQAKMDYVEGHDPFGGGGGASKPPQGGGQHEQQPHHDAGHPIKASVGQGGANHKADVLAVQRRLLERGLDPGAIDGLMGPHTLAAIKHLQASFMSAVDGLIEPGLATVHHLFFEHGIVHPTEHHKPEQHHAAGHEQPPAHGKAPEVVPNDAHLAHIQPGVKLTGPIAANYRVLQPFLPAGTVMTSGYRSDEDQASLIHRYFHSHGGPAAITDTEKEREWLAETHGMVIGRVGSSPHRTGLAFDLSGAPIGEIQAAVMRCVREKPAEFHYSRLIFERANNCVHVEVSH